MTRRNDRDLQSRAQAKIAQRRKKLSDPRSLSGQLEIHRVELELQNEELRAARDLAEAALARYTELFDFAPCDLGLPVMDGFAVARAIRGDPALRDRRLVAISGYARPDDVARSRRAGFDGHLAKPVTLAGLQAELASAARAPG